MKINDEFQRIYEKTLTETYPIEGGYLVSYKPLPGKYSFLSINTMFDKFDVQDKKKLEIRKPDLISMVGAKAHFSLMDLPLSAVSTVEELHAFFRIGGHAIIDGEMVKEHWSDLLNPKIVVSDDRSNGFLEYESLEKKYVQRFAKGQLRMEVLKRDNFRCRICGTGPDDDVHYRIEAHHIKPWCEGGMTSPNNLITLCTTCHDGISVVDRQTLYSKIGLDFSNVDHEIIKLRDDFSYEQLRSYRYVVANTVLFRVTNKSFPKI